MINNAINEFVAVPVSKVCTKCKITLPGTAEFFLPNKNGLRPECRECSKKYQRYYKAKNPEKWKKYNADYHKSHPIPSVKYETILLKNREYHHKNKDKCNENSKKSYLKRKELLGSKFFADKSANWRKENRDKYRFSQLESNRRRRLKIKNRINFSISSGINQSLKKGKNGRRWELLVGYNLSQLLSHIERQFGKGMNWENYGEWEIDHIVPLKSFRFENYDDPDFRTAWSLTNLRPLWRVENQSKGSKRIFLL